MKFELAALAKSDCPNLWNDLLRAGRLEGGHLIVPDDLAGDILARCPQVPAATLTVKQELKGAGDIVALVAQPIAKAVDRVLGTNLATCAPCKRRQEALNKALPIG